MLTPRARAASAGLIRVAVVPLARVGATPNMLTVVGCLAHVPATWAIAVGQLRLGAVLLGLAAAVDGLDGSLARETGKATRFGAFLDSTLDRVSEILVFLGLLLYAVREPSGPPPALVLVALGGSLMVSYTRARSEGIGSPTKAGILGRLERMLVLVAGLLLGLLVPAMWVLAVGTWTTVAQRVVDVRRSLGREA